LPDPFSMMKVSPRKEATTEGNRMFKNRKVAGVVMAGSLLGAAMAGSFVAPPLAAFAADTSTTATAQATARTPGQWITDSLKGLVGKGTITQAQSDAVAAALKDAQPKGGPGGGHGGRGGGPINNAKVAAALGMSEADLHTAMDTKSLADIAKAHNVDIQKVIDVLVTAENQRIDQSVTDGRSTQAEADAQKAKTTDRVKTMVNDVRPARGPGGPDGGGPGAPAAPDATTSTTPTTAAA
jgi:hypothetical protein